MPEYRVEIWFLNLDVPRRIPSTTVEARTEMEAASLALDFFKRTGQAVDATDYKLTVCDVDSGSEEHKGHYSKDDVLGWLSRPERKQFVQEHDLRHLIDS